MTAPDFREKLLAGLGGPWPEPCPLHVRPRETIPKDGCRIESLTKVILMLVVVAALSGCQSPSRHYRAVEKNLQQSYKNGDITREEYDEALGRYRKAAKGETTDAETPGSL